MRHSIVALAVSLTTIAACNQQPPAAVPAPAAPSTQTDATAPKVSTEPEQPHQPERSPLVGKPAPDVEQELLDGSHFSLKQQKDKKVVILDFWATWCGPCVREMPLVAKVADKYRDKDVALYCVDQGEDAETVRAFLDEKELDVTVSLDSQNEAGSAYGVEGIPTLVLIDKAGVVRSVHLGYRPDIAEKLKEELDAILAGKDSR
ncbi:MAG: hypothetical protein B7Z73_08680 [Planctomycetia bacterium 21-64-5]|nr:MAG: hypothetical protein B7Z73_08680 [Planctomycetia bacterium 21-64-5]HQU43089.1 TlpA disulfide reductase family protein [Pirellulales bacterium]